MIILGLDPAQNTGLAVYDTERSYPDITARVLKAEGESYEEKCYSIARKLLVVIQNLDKLGKRPDLIAIEAPLRQKVGIQRSPKMMGQVMEDGQSHDGDGGGLNSVISSNQITGAILGALAAKPSIRWVKLAVNSWHSDFFGKGFHPPMKAVKVRGQTVMKKDWKRAAREQCAREGIVVTNNDQADAVCIAIAAKASGTFKLLQYERQRSAA